MLSEVIGNSAVKNRITALLESGRLPHAIILEGQRGTGRFTMAASIAKTLVCDSKNACGACHNCRQAEKLTHPDVLVYAPDKTVFTVDKVRKINEDALVKPNQAACKVMILQNCEQMNAEAQNAFLKTLEEPPGKVQFILITTNSKMLLDTIRSRCAIFTVVPPDFAEGLQFLCNRGYDKEKAEAALIDCEGNIGRALAMLDGQHNSLGINVSELMLLAASDKTVELLKVFTPLERDRNKMLLLLEQLAQFTAKAIRDYAVGRRAECGFSMSGLLALQEAISAADTALQQNGNKALLLTVLCEKIVRAAQM